ncbi:zinc finger BED domain-containing protein 4-like [Neoarius graeffei]|uniref:zinc finger BED domain-containing protein 4-like n=1 Tax=Neoarius graeffei TaxID=443677 RepID=UPI00298CB03E|nr:zinc finger BED domain-containing protein 4-like [Neoarius graeffei]
MSAVWKYFKVSESENRVAVCNECDAKVSRGGINAKTFSTSGLISHLKTNHPAKHDEYARESAAAAAKRKASSAPSVADVFEKTKKFASESPKAIGITKKIMEYMALDDQPFSVVEDTGFRRLMAYIEPRYTLPSRRYFADVCLPELYHSIATRVHELLAKDSNAYLSFTTDIWTSDVSPTSMLSLTAQWVDENFKLRQVVLQSQEFKGSHTAGAISDAFNRMFESWQIDRARVHAVVSDNARNMVKAMEDNGLKGIRCMAHTLQIAVNEGVLSQRSIVDIISTGRKIVGHFKHSPLAYSRLQALQEQFGMPPKRFQQDVSTRWNSTYYMLQSLLSQKQVLAAYAADNDLPATFTSYQWLLIENTLSLLAPFEQLTKEISSSKASAADVIPLLAALTRLLKKESETDHGVKTTKSALLEAVNRRFCQADTEPLFCIATVLDPRYKDYYIDVEKKRRVREMVQAELDLFNPLGDGEVKHREGAEGTQTKRICTTESVRAPSLSDMFEEIIQESDPDLRQPSATAQQLDCYLSEVLIPRNDDPLTYWRTNRGRFPELARMARRYLAAPCTSTDSERLFSAASNVLDERRNRLTCDKAEKLLFIKKNLPLFLKE